MNSLFDNAASKVSGIQGQVSDIQGSVTDTLLAAKSDVGESAGKIQGEASDMLNKAPELIVNTARDIRVQAEETASSIAERVKTGVNNIAFAAFFAGILEKCCAPFNKKKD